MSLPITALETWIFLVSLLLWALLLFGGFALGKPHAENRHRMPTWTRLCSSFVLVLVAWIWFAVSQGTQVANLAAWIAIGMSLGFIGDIFMAQLFNVEPHVLYGMGAFGLGHIAYIIGLARVSHVHSLPFPNWTVMGIWWLVALVGWLVVVYRGSKPSILHYVALPYALLLSSTAGAATSLALMNGSFFLIPIGAALFLFSDLLLAAELFNGLKFPLIGDVVWLTYGPGQMLIVFGVILFTIATGL